METKDLERRLVSLEQKVEKLEKSLSVRFVDDSAETSISKKISIKEFLLNKKTDNDVESTLAIAYFLEHFENALSFNVDDIKSGYMSAKIAPPGNINDKINMNIRKGHIMDAKERKDAKKAWVVTATGEKFIENKLNNVTLK